jgi:hypothetical protein
MPAAQSFQQPCPCCGRRLMIAIVNLARRVFCGHCGRAFVASKGGVNGEEKPQSAVSILVRADRLLTFLESQGQGDRNRGSTTVQPRADADRSRTAAASSGWRAETLGPCS